ncbi:Non-specific lipid transfer protein GPI-anchored 2 like [Actinidia chinensis var. chinensis]|uniref:Non-specific lipid transfer protein GPI-anchored 2 like n=1 Tax=Actinidia chinensis var. chinensis TaxID=1590841 RepID=A0A2R6P7U6_ACTCC|nr:Non-specific lipid transfer protein GPI-anchored 2 like [Actinidia chinensis var. chinensis]
MTPATPIAGKMIVTATALLAVAVLVSGAAAPAPAPESGSGSGPVVQSPEPVSGPAPGPGGIDCISSLANVSDCLTYVEAGSNLTKPDEGCCPALAGLVESEPICLCELVAGNATESLGIEINMKKALKLPSVCGVQTPPVSLCSLAGYPVPVPMPSPGPGGMAPESGSNNGSSPNGASGIAASVQLPILVASLTTLLFFG